MDGRFDMGNICNLVTVMIISYSNGIDKNCFWAFVQSKTVVLYYYMISVG